MQSQQLRKQYDKSHFLHVQNCDDLYIPIRIMRIFEDLVLQTEENYLQVDGENDDI
jgi:hypothetical protein